MRKEKGKEFWLEGGQATSPGGERAIGGNPLSRGQEDFTGGEGGPECCRRSGENKVFSGGGVRCKLPSWSARSQEGKVRKEHVKRHDHGGAGV